MCMLSANFFIINLKTNETHETVTRCFQFISRNRWFLCPHGDRIAQKYEDCCSQQLFTKQVDTETVFYVIKFLLKTTAYKKCLKEERRS